MQYKENPSQTQESDKNLVAKRQAETLTSDEHRELPHLSERLEKLQAQRIESLAALARLRRTSLPELMEKFGFQMLEYV